MNKNSIFLCFLSVSAIIHVIIIFANSWQDSIQIHLDQKISNAQKYEIKMQFNFEKKNSAKKIEKVAPDKTDRNEDAPQETKELASNNTTPTALENYLNQIRQLIEKNKFYPAPARRLRIEGEILLRFVINRNGQMTNLEFLQKTKFEPLNAAAKSAVIQVKKFPPIPPEILDEELIINQKISFKLE
jgi:TonB family protein